MFLSKLWEKGYGARMETEIEHYKEIFKDGLFQKVPPVWNEVEAVFSKKIKKMTGVAGLPEYVARYVKGKKKIRVLSLGSGSCGVELELMAPILKKQGTEMILTSADINQQILDQAGAEAKKRKIKFEGIVQDINNLSLEENKYDVIMAFAALHHFENLDLVTKQINKGLKPRGIFVTVDIPTRNGYLLWDETKEVVDNIWKILPTKFKFDHTAHAEITYMDKFPDVNYAKNSFECANSEAIMPALAKNLTEIDYVPSMTLARRFFDTKFGPNFDLRKKLDKSLFDFIMNLDEYYLENNILKAETFFGAYKKK